MKHLDAEVENTCFDAGDTELESHYEWLYRIQLEACEEPLEYETPALDTIQMLRDS